MVGERWKADDGDGAYGLVFLHSGRRYVVVVEGLGGQRGATVDQVVKSFRFE